MKRAFVVGSNGPAHLGPLKFAESDAAKLAECLRLRRLGFEVVTTSPSDEPGQVRDRLYAVADSCKPGDTFLCYFAGHGRPEGDELRLLWHQSDLNKMLGTTLAATIFTEAVQHCRASNRLLILDCCRAGAAMPAGFRGSSSSESINLIPSNANYLALLAADRWQDVREFDELEGGFLVHHMCDILNGPVGRFVSTSLTIGELMDELGRRANAHNTTNPQQPTPVPYLYGQNRGSFTFLPHPGDWEPAFIEVAGMEFSLLPRINPDLDFNSDYLRDLLRGISVTTWLGRHPVTNRQFDAISSFRSIGGPEGEIWDPEQRWVPGFRPRGDVDFNDPDQPTVCVDLRTAIRYARSFTAAQGSWSSEWIKGSVQARFHIQALAEWQWANAEGGAPGERSNSNVTARVGRGAGRRSPLPIDREGGRGNWLGIADLEGNVWEWAYSHRRISHIHAAIAPDGDSGMDGYIVGGGYLDDLDQVPESIHYMMLPDGLDTRHSDLGFRLEMTIPLEHLVDDLADRVEYYHELWGVGSAGSRSLRRWFSL